jgi:hypothetical protein
VIGKAHLVFELYLTLLDEFRCQLFLKDNPELKYVDIMFSPELQTDMWSTKLNEAVKFHRQPTNPSFLSLNFALGCNLFEPFSGWTLNESLVLKLDTVEGSYFYFEHL